MWPSALAATKEEHQPKITKVNKRTTRGAADKNYTRRRRNTDSLGDIDEEVNDDNSGMLHQHQYRA